MDRVSEFYSKPSSGSNYTIYNQRGGYDANFAKRYLKRKRAERQGFLNFFKNVVKLSKSIEAEDAAKRLQMKGKLAAAKRGGYDANFAKRYLHRKRAQRQG